MVIVAKNDGVGHDASGGFELGEDRANEGGQWEVITELKGHARRPRCGLILVSSFFYSTVTLLILFSILLLHKM